jgi:hypothetical protein
MTDFQESDINFSFQDASWAVVKYDEHTAHRKVERVLKSTKAVDFMGIHGETQLFLIEVKNYRGHTRDESTRAVLNVGGEELMRRIAVKVRDSVATATGAARFSTNDEEFFTQVNGRLLDSGVQLTIIACIEWEESNQAERRARMGIWQQKLKQKLAWLHPVRVSVNSVSNITGILPDVQVSFA